MNDQPGRRDIDHRLDATPEVAIVVLNWNSWADTVECLESLQRVTYPNHRIIVVDNGSTDESVNRLEAWARGEVQVESTFAVSDPGLKPVNWIQYDRSTAEAGGVPGDEARLKLHPPRQRFALIFTGENLGFAEGCNVGIRYALNSSPPASYVCLLNNDTVVDPEFLNCLVGVAEADRSIGIVGGKVLYYHEPGRIWYGGGYVSLWGKGPGYVSSSLGKEDAKVPGELANVSFVTGCLMLIHRDVLACIGGLDPWFFFGGEDADFCVRVRQRGYRIVFNGDAIVYHKVAKTYDPYATTHTYYVYRGKLAFMRKHLPAPLWWPWVCGFAIYILMIAPIRRLFQTRSSRATANMVSGGLKALVANFRHSVRTTTSL